MVTVEARRRIPDFPARRRGFYDTAIPAQADVGRLIRHLSDKMWFAEVRQDSLAMIAEYYGADVTPTHRVTEPMHRLARVTCCHPMSGRYCSVGRELWLQYRAECVRMAARMRCSGSGRSRRNGRMKSRSGR